MHEFLIIEQAAISFAIMVLSIEDSHEDSRAGTRKAALRKVLWQILFDIE